MSATTMPTRVSRRRIRLRLPQMSALGWVGFVLVLVFCLLALVGPLISLPPNERTGGPLEPPSAAHWFGTDDLGRDLFARTAVGARLSLIVAVCSVVAGLVVAVPIGLLAGYRGGTWVDDLLMRVMEALQALPVFVLALFVVGMTGTGSSEIGPLTLAPEAKVVLLLAVSFLPFFARVTRAATLVEVQEEYVDALRVVGVSRRHILLGELLPNVAPPVLVQAFLWVGIAIFSESALSFLGLGIQPPEASLGNLLSDATSSLMIGGWWLSVVPGLAILFVTIGINLLGDEVERLLGGRR
ncbi:MULTISPECIES: ABC transporter permease [Mumia]|uniref:ABC transporter permease n=1 Tax=Mumia TaxID=1546255 RepID=UPI00142074C1|nr:MULTISPECIES: ABC transporter permease [unclassified Mumia]QMW66236.1 ABC transporter permease [Mumia sp. ZJ1417]